MEHFDKTDLIERYFEDSLSEEEKEIFQNQLDSDPDFAQSVEIERDIIESIQTSANNDLRNRLETIHQKKIAGKTPDFLF